MIIATPNSNARFTCLIPQGISLHPQHTDGSARFAAYLMLRTNAAKERRELGHWINLSCDYMRARNKYWDDVRKHAIREGWLECNERYCTGKNPYHSKITAFSKSYRFREDLRTGKFTVYEFSRKPLNWDKRLKQDHDTKAGQALADRLSKVWLPDDIEPRNYWDHYTFETIRQGWLYSGRCQYGRFFSPYTSLAGDHRRRLEAKEPLASLDIRGSQPLLLGAIALKHPIYTNAKDVREWLDICEQGDIYDHICETSASFMDRDAAKLELMKVMFAPKDQMVYNPVYAVIERNYPTLASYLKLSKHDHHKGVAESLQRMESGIMIDTVAHEYCKAYPNNPIVTVHDEVIVPKRLATHLSKRIKKAAQKHGITPQIRIIEHE